MCRGSHVFISEYEEVAVGKECGDTIQIKLSKPTTDPLACKKIAEKTVKSPACGDYFEINSGTCRCTPSDKTCAMGTDAGTTVYRILHKEGTIYIAIFLQTHFHLILFS